MNKKESSAILIKEELKKKAEEENRKKIEKSLDELEESKPESAKEQRDKEIVLELTGRKKCDRPHLGGGNEGTLVDVGYYQRPEFRLGPGSGAWYGNYCGPGGYSEFPAGSDIWWGPNPINQVDKCCQEHDQCYVNCGLTGLDGFMSGFVLEPCARNCDTEMCICLFFANPPSGSNQMEAQMIIGFLFRCSFGWVAGLFV